MEGSKEQNKQHNTYFFSYNRGSRKPRTPLVSQAEGMRESLLLTHGPREGGVGSQGEEGMRRESDVDQREEGPMKKITNYKMNHQRNHH